MLDQEREKLQQELAELFIARNKMLPGLVAVRVELNSETGQPILFVAVTDPAQVDVETLDRGDLDVRIVEGEPVRLLSALQPTVPVPPWGVVMGGDPVWHPLDGWGTIGFASASLTFTDQTGSQKTIGNAVVSCNHILAMLDQAAIGDQVNTYRARGPLKLDTVWPVTNGAVPPIDVAVAKAQSFGDFAPAEVRGLGRITGVGIAAPGDRVFKCGARTSITTAIDQGTYTFVMGSYGGRSVTLRTTPGGFADVGDSGAAVLDQARRLVGIVVAGTVFQGQPLTLYLAAVPRGTGALPYDALFVDPP